MPEATLQPQPTLARKAAKYWARALVILLYLAVVLMPAAVGETQLAENVRLIGADRFWTLGILYGILPAAGQPWSSRVVLANFGRLSFGVALIAAVVTMFTKQVPVFYLLYALGAAGMGAVLGCILGPRCVVREMALTFDAKVGVTRRAIRLVTAVAFVLLFCAAVPVMAYQLFVYHNWILLAYGACAVWGALIAKPALNKKRPLAA